jgi:glycine betaine/proline transport system substrate-binding protein
MNKDMAYDCGKPFGEIWKYAWIGMKDKWPTAYRIAKNYQFDSAEMNALVAQTDLEGKSPEEVANAWVAANQDKIKKWASE